VQNNEFIWQIELVDESDVAPLFTRGLPHFADTKTVSLSP
jgi:hypothetical protein